jgi:hypothetical protein
MLTVSPWEGKGIGIGCPLCLALAKLMDRLWLGTARQTETEAAPIRYWAELVGTDTKHQAGNPVADRAAPVVLACDHMLWTKWRAK